MWLIFYMCIFFQYIDIYLLFERIEETFCSQEGRSRRGSQAENIIFKWCKFYRQVLLSIDHEFHVFRYSTMYPYQSLELKIVLDKLENKMQIRHMKTIICTAVGSYHKSNWISFNHSQWWIEKFYKECVSKRKQYSTFIL